MCWSGEVRSNRFADHTSLYVRCPRGFLRFASRLDEDATSRFCFSMAGAKDRSCRPIGNLPSARSFRHHSWQMASSISAARMVFSTRWSEEVRRRTGIVRHQCTDNLTGISKSTLAPVRQRSDSNCRLASGWLLRGVFVFGRILGAPTATANFFFFAGFKVADEHVELDNPLLFRIFVGFRLLCHNCASCESNDDDRVLVCRAKTALVRVDVATVGWSRRISETSLDSH